MTPDHAGEQGVALWRRIMRALEAEIADATLPPGGRLPTEAQLAARFAVTRLTARMPLPHEAELLKLARNRPLLVTENVNVDQHGAVVEFGISRYPTPRVQIVFEP